MKKIYLFANWKMYLGYRESQKLAMDLSKKIKTLPKNIEMVVFPSGLSIDKVKNTLPKVGAQNVYWVDKGGYTGEISAKMYKDMGAKYALVGHSERRHQFNESNEDVNKKMEAVLSVSMTPVLCVGETAVERKKGLTDNVVGLQIKKAYENISWNGKKMIIAYEPVWAIGSGHACSAVEAEKEHMKIRELVNKLFKIDPVILYGGSVRPENAHEYLSSHQIDGVLVGGASTILKSWVGIINIAKSI